MDRGAWRATAHRVTKSRTRLNTGYIVKVTPYSYFYFSFTCSVSAHPASSHPSALTAFCVIYLDVCLVKNILLTGLVFLFVLLYFFNLWLCILCMKWYALGFFFWGGVAAFVWDFKNSIYLAVPGLSCSMWDSIPQPETEPKPPPLSRVLATGPPCKSRWIPVWNLT